MEEQTSQNNLYNQEHHILKDQQAVNGIQEALINHNDKSEEPNNIASLNQNGPGTNLTEKRELGKGATPVSQVESSSVGVSEANNNQQINSDSSVNQNNFFSDNHGLNSNQRTAEMVPDQTSAIVSNRPKRNILGVAILVAVALILFGGGGVFAYKIIREKSENGTQVQESNLSTQVKSDGAIETSNESTEETKETAVGETTPSTSTSTPKSASTTKSKPATSSSTSNINVSSSATSTSTNNVETPTTPSVPPENPSSSEEEEVVPPPPVPED